MNKANSEQWGRGIDNVAIVKTLSILNPRERARLQIYYRRDGAFA